MKIWVNTKRSIGLKEKAALRAAEMFTMISVYTRDCHMFFSYEPEIPEDLLKDTNDEN